MKYARVSNDSTVIEVFVEPENFTLHECFTPQVAATFIPCPDDVEGGWILEEDETFVAPPPPIEPPVDPPTDTTI